MADPPPSGPPGSPGPFGPLPAALRARLPEFELPDADGDRVPSEPDLLVELADFLVARLVLLEQTTDVCRRAFALVEERLTGGRSGSGPPTGEDVIGETFFDSFPPDRAGALTPWLGPASRVLLERRDCPPPHASGP